MKIWRMVSRILREEISSGVIVSVQFDVSSEKRKMADETGEINSTHAHQLSVKKTRIGRLATPSLSLIPVSYYRYLELFCRFLEPDVQ